MLSVLIQSSGSVSLRNHFWRTWMNGAWYNYFMGVGRLGPCLEAASGKYPTPYCMQIMIMQLLDLDGKQKRGKGTSLLLSVGKVSQKLLWVRPKLPPISPFKQRSVLHISSWEEKYSDFIEEVDAVSCSPSWLLRGRDQRERRLLGKKRKLAETLMLSNLRLEWRLKGNLYSRGNWESRLVCSVIATEGG